MINNDSIVNSKLPAASSSVPASTAQPLATLSSCRPSKPMLAVPPSVVSASYINQMSLNSGLDKEGELVQKHPVLETNWVAEYTGSEPSADKGKKVAELLDVLIKDPSISVPDDVKPMLGKEGALSKKIQGGLGDKTTPLLLNNIALFTQLVSQLTPEKQNEALQSWPGSEIALCLPGINSDLHNEMVRLNQDDPILSAADNYLDEALHKERLLDTIYDGNQVHIPTALKNIAYLPQKEALKIDKFATSHQELQSTRVYKTVMEFPQKVAQKVDDSIEAQAEVIQQKLLAFLSNKPRHEEDYSIYDFTNHDKSEDGTISDAEIKAELLDNPLLKSIQSMYEQEGKSFNFEEYIANLLPKPAGPYTEEGIDPQITSEDMQPLVNDYQRSLTIGIEKNHTVGPRPDYTDIHELFTHSNTIDTMIDDLRSGDSDKLDEALRALYILSAQFDNGSPFIVREAVGRMFEKSEEESFEDFCEKLLDTEMSTDSKMKLHYIIDTAVEAQEASLGPGFVSGLIEKAPIDVINEYSDEAEIMEVGHLEAVMGYMLDHPVPEQALKHLHLGTHYDQIEDINEKDFLTTIVMTGDDPNETKLLLPSINESENFRYSVMSAIASNKGVEFTKELLSEGNPDTTKAQLALLNDLIVKDEDEFFKEIIKLPNGNDLNSHEKEDYSLVGIALNQDKDNAILDFLITDMSDTNSKLNADVQIPMEALSTIVREGRDTLLERVIDLPSMSSSTLNATDRFGNTLLMQAIKQRQYGSVDLLLKELEPSNTNSKIHQDMLSTPDKSGNSPVKMAINKGQLDLAKNIMEKTLNPTTADQELIVKAEMSSTRSNRIDDMLAHFAKR